MRRTPDIDQIGRDTPEIDIHAEDQEDSHKENKKEDTVAKSNKPIQVVIDPLFGPKFGGWSIAEYFEFKF